MLLELKLGARLTDLHKQQAAAYARTKKCPTVLALFKREDAQYGDKVTFQLLSPPKVAIE